MARRLLAQEIGVEVGGREVSIAADRVCRKLSTELSRLVSPVGSQAMLSRAIHVARAEFPFLEGVSAGPEGGLDRLEERVLAVDSTEADGGAMAVLSALLDLLVGFIGEDFTLRLVSEVWPVVAEDAPIGSGRSERPQAAA